MKPPPSSKVRLEFCTKALFSPFRIDFLNVALRDPFLLLHGLLVRMERMLPSVDCEEVPSIGTSRPGSPGKGFRKLYDLAW